MTKHRFKNKKTALWGLTALFLSVLILSVWTFKSSGRYDLPRDWNQIMDSELIVATDSNRIDYFVDNDSILGFQYELIKAFAQEHHLSLKVVYEPLLNKALKDLSRRKIDIIIRPIQTLENLRSSYSFSHPIQLNKWVLVQHKSDSLLTNPLDLEKKTIYLPRQSPAIYRLKNLMKEIGDTIFLIQIPNVTAEDLFYKIDKHEIDFGVVSWADAKVYQSIFKHVDCNTDLGFTQFESWVMRKEAIVLTDSLNRWLERYTADESFDKLKRKYGKD